MKKLVVAFLIINILLVMSWVGIMLYQQIVNPQPPQQSYWFMLHRKSEKEILYRGVPGEPKQSTVIKTFTVKVGIPGERPTPLPTLFKREYWIITEKHAEPDNPETAPYFITLDIPAPSEPPYGPAPYNECNGQCDWIVEGDFGLHGIGGDKNKLSKTDPGSSGCVRHSDEDITYLYKILDPTKEEIRYYIEDK